MNISIQENVSENIHKNIFAWQLVNICSSANIKFYDFCHSIPASVLKISGAQKTLKFIIQSVHIHIQLHHKMTQYIFSMLI